MARDPRDNLITKTIGNVYSAAKNAASVYNQAYQKAAPYIPFAPKITTPQQVQRSPIINNVVKPLVKPALESGRKLMENINMELYHPSQTIGGFAKNVGVPLASTTLNTYGLAKLKALPTVLNAGLSGVINTAAGDKKQSAGKRFIQGAKQGLEAAPMISAIGSFSNPLIDSAANKLSRVVTNPLSKTLLSRGATGVANIPEGMIMNKAMGQGYDLGQAGWDLVTGFISGGPSKFKVKGLTDQTGGIHPDDIKDIASIYKRFAEGYKIKTGQVFKADIDNFTKDKDIVDGLFTHYFGVKGKELKSMSFDEKVNTLFQVAQDDFRNRTPHMGITEDRSTPYAEKRQFNTDTSGVEYAKKKLPGILFSTSKKTAQGGTKKEHPFIEGLEQDKANYGNPQEPFSPRGPGKPPPGMSTGPDAAYAGNVKGGGFTGKPEDSVSQAFSNWVNERRATATEGTVIKKSFTDLVPEGMQGVFKYQEGEKSGRFADVRKYFDDKHRQLNRSNVDTRYRSDYLPQLWSNAPEEVAQILGKRMGLKPSFTLSRVIEDYKKGIELGLTPKFTNIADLAGWYEKTANKALADRKFFDFLNNETIIMPKGEAPSDWVALDPDRFPQMRVKTGEGTYQGVYKAPKAIADMINDHLKTPEGTMANLAKMVSGIKNRVFSAGIPFTGLNFHGINILVRNTLASKGLVGGFLKGSAYMLQPHLAESYINKNLKSAPFAIKSGLSLGVEDNIFKMGGEELPETNIAKKGYATFNKGLEKMFSEPLFQKVIPALKLQHFNDTFQEFAQSMPKDKAAREAAKVVNDIFGGINTEQIGRSRETQTMLRAFLFAPDWMETNLNLGKNIVKSLANPMDPKGKIYRRFALNMAVAYTGANVINKMMSGHYMWENEPGNLFNIDTGSYTQDGKKRHMRVFGTAIDFLRIPLDIAHGLAKGDPTPIQRSVRNRLSTPFGTAVGLMTNTDYLGRPIFGKDKYGNEMTPAQSAGGIASQISQNILPSQVSAFIDVVSGRSNVEQGVAQALEIPVRYSGGAYSKNDKKLADEISTSGGSGKDIADTLKESRDIKNAPDDTYMEKSQRLQEAEASIKYKSLQDKVSTAPTAIDRYRAQQALTRFEDKQDTNVSITQQSYDKELGRLRSTYTALMKDPSMAAKDRQVILKEIQTEYAALRQKFHGLNIKPTSYTTPKSGGRRRGLKSRSGRKLGKIRIKKPKKLKIKKMRIKKFKLNKAKKIQTT